MKANTIIEMINGRMCDDVLADIYVDKDKLSYERKRYIEAIEQYITRFGDDDVWIYSAPGRSEIGGNHTDHQHGEVLAASINHDVIAVAKKLDDQVVRIVSDGYNNMIAIHLDDLDKKDKEEGSTQALIRGVLAKTKENGHTIGGFQAYITSDVLIGAGLSSSAAFKL